MLFDDLIPAKPSAAPGAFADLVPAKRVGAFDDLVPKGGSFLPEVGKGVAAGTVSTTGTMIKGASGQNDAMLQSRIDNAKARIAIMDTIDRGGEVPVGSIADGDELDTANVYRELSPEQRKEFRRSQERVLETAVQPDVTQSPLYQAGQSVQDWSQEQFAAAKDYENTWTRSITEGLGSTIPWLAAGVAGRGGLAAGTAAGSFASSGEALDRAVQAGATKEQIIAAIKAGGLPGLTEQVPIETLFNRIPLPLVGKFTNALAKIAAQALVEGGQEAVQQVMQNMIARYQYKPDQDLTEGVAEAASIGAIIGGGLKTVEQGVSQTLGAGDQPAARPGVDLKVNEQPALAVPEGAADADVLFGAEPDDGPSPVASPLDPFVSKPLPEMEPASDLDRRQNLPEMDRARDIDRADSPRLTPEDRASPLPNNLIDDGKAILEDVLAPKATAPVDTFADLRPVAAPPASVLPERAIAPQEAAAPLHAAPVDRTDTTEGEWVRFAAETGTRNIPRSAMPQIKAEHRGALVNYLAARGITHQEETVPAASLKPTQAEFSRRKVEKAKAFEGGDRSILVSSDGHVLDGHHQWLAKLDAGEDVKIIRLGAPIEQLLVEATEFPSSTVAPIKGKTKREAAPRDIVQFLAAAGGIRDHRGELNSLNVRKHFVPGIGRLVRDIGMDIDKAREAAEEAGYIGQAGDYQTTTVADLLNAIDRNMRGERVFARADAGRAEARAAADDKTGEGAKQAAMRAELDEVLKDIGGNLRPGEMEEVLALVADGVWPEEAVAEVMERNALAAEAEAEQNADQEEPDVPFDTGRETGARGEPSPAGKSQASEGARGTAPSRAEPGSSEPAGAADRGSPEETALAPPSDADIPAFLKNDSTAKPRASRRQTAGTEEILGGEIQYRLSPEFIAKADAAEKSLRRTLDRMGLQGIGLRVWESMRAAVDGKTYVVEGQYLRGLIDVALKFDNPDSTLHHEALHAMKALGLFTDNEWSILSRKSNKEWRDKYQIAENYGMFDEAVQIEEGIAAAFTDWIEGARMDGLIAASFRKMKVLLKGLYQALTGIDIASVDDIFQRVASGQVGKRPVTAREPVPATTSRSVLNEAPGTGRRTQSEIVDTVDGPREQLVLPGAEKISDKQLAERKMEGRKGSTKAQKDVGGLPLFSDEKDQMSLFQIAWHGSSARIKSEEATTAVAQVRKAASGALGSRIMDAIKRGKNDGETVSQYSHRKMIDYLHPLRTMIESAGGTVQDAMNAYLQARMADDAVVARIQDMHGAYVQPMVEALAKSGASLEDLHKYLYARHAAERNRVVGLRNEEGSDLYKAVTDHDIKGASGWSTNEAKKVLRDLRADPAKFAGIQEAARLARQMLDTNLADQRQAGLISAETYDLLTKQWQHYVPLRSQDALDENGDFAPGRGRGFDVRGDEFQAATGRFSEAENIPAWAISLAERTHMRSEHNNVGKAVLRFLSKYDPKGEKLAHVYWSKEAPGFGDLEKAPSVHRRVINSEGKAVDKVVPPSTLSPAMFAVKDGGRTYYVQFADEKVGIALKNMGVMHLDALSRLARKWTGFQSLINTRANPAFVPINIIRDAATGGIHLLDEGFTKTEAAKIVGSIPKAWGALWRNARGKPGSGEYDKALKEYIGAGGKITFEPHKTLEDTITGLRKQMKDALGGRKTTWAKLKAIWNTFAKFIGDLNDAGENGMRLAAYIAAREKGRTVKQAAFLGRDLTVDFKKHGEIGPLMNSWFVFFNASIQGNYNIASRLLKSKKVRRAAYMIAASGVLVDLLNRSMSGDDDDEESFYSKMLRNEPWKFERQMVIFYGSEEGDYFTIPLPYGYNAIYHMGVQASAAAFGDVDPVAAISATTRVAFDAFNPIGSGGSWLNMVMPTVLDPAVEIATNQSFTGAPISPTRFPGDVKPDSQSHFASTPDQFRDVAQFFNAATGGNEVEPGLVDVSPDTYEHLWGYVVGGIGRFFGQSLETGEKIVTGKTNELEWENIPIVRSFRGKFDDDGRRAEYYRLREEVQTAKTRYVDYLQAGAKEEADNFKTRYPVEVGVIGIFDGAEKQLRRARKAKRAIDLDDSLTRSEKDEKLKPIEEIEMQIMNSARLAYSKLRREQN